MAAISGGRHAVKQVDPSSDSLQQVRRESDAHKITGYSNRQRGMKQLQHAMENRLRLAYREASNRYTGPGTSVQRAFQRAEPKLVVHAALNDGPQRLRGSKSGKGGSSNVTR